MTQRYLAGRLSLSLGKVNFLINALIEKGIIEIKNFKQSRHKLGYAYLLTPHGINIKLQLVQQFLDWKTRQYAKLQEEIESLRRESILLSNGNIAAAAERADGAREEVTR